MATCTAVWSGVCRPPRSSADGAALKSAMMTYHGKLLVGLHEVFEEPLPGVSKRGRVR